MMEGNTALMLAISLGEGEKGGKEEGGDDEE
jgi:hypothetical protein